MEQMMINHWAVLVSAVFSLVLGGVWYSPVLFYKGWMKASGVTEEQVKASNPLRTYLIAFLLAYIMSYNLAFFLGDEATDWKWGLTAGFLAGFGWAATMFTVIALFEFRSLKYILINAGYMIVYFSAIGLILGAWR
ncbi:MAG: DUF1761 domain-containing protein [Bacteroidales bacterium]